MSNAIAEKDNAVAVSQVQFGERRVELIGTRAANDNKAQQQRGDDAARMGSFRGENGFRRWHARHLFHHGPIWERNRRIDRQPLCLLTPAHETMLTRGLAPGPLKNDA